MDIGTTVHLPVPGPVSGPRVWVLVLSARLVPMTLEEYTSGAAESAAENEQVT